MGRKFLLLGVMSIVAACGGGGGGDSGGGGGGGAGAGGGGSFQLTESNALEAGQYALDPIEQALFSGSIAVDTAFQLSQQSRSVITSSCGATTVTLRYEDRDSTATVTRGDVVRLEHGDCGGESRNITLTLSAFDLAAGSIGGRLELDNSIGSTAFRGELTLSVTASSGSARWFGSNVSLTLTSEGTQQTVRATASELIVSAASYELSILGGSVDSVALGGAYTFATSPALTGARRRMPSTGAVVLTTSSGSRASFGPPSTPTLGEATVDYRVAPPRSDYGAPRQSLWTHLVRGYLFEWRPNRPPVISNLTIQPTNPIPGVSLFAAYGVTDPDLGDTLTTEITWRKNGAVVATNTRTLTMPLARNDVVSVTVTASDGREATPTTQTASVTIGNRPPVLTNLLLTPELPDTTADLVVTASANDPDNDPLQATYVWRRNGDVLDQYTTTVLPASETSRGDNISVTVTFDDDGLSVSGSAGARIVDSLPRVVVGSAPESATYGMPLAFTATANDADGDPVDLYHFVLDHGPAGMTVDSVSGRVTWTPSGPMFDRTLAVSWGLRLSFDGAPVTAGSVRVDDATRSYPILRTGIQIPLLRSLRIGDFDDDDDSEMLLLGMRWLLEIESDGVGGYRQSWAYPFAFDVDDASSPGAQRAMAAGDVDGDGKHEIFVTTANGLVKLDGAERRVVASVELQPDERCVDVEIGDIDAVGAAEVVCAVTKDSRPERVVVYRADDLSVRTSLSWSGNAVYGVTLALGNVDADAALEIVTSGGDVIDGKTTAVQWNHLAGFSRVALGDIDGNGVDEIVATEFTELVAFRANVATELFRRSVGLLDAMLIADLDGDARAEILAGDNQWGNVTAYRYNGGAGTADVVFQIDSQDHGVSAFGVGDVDGDSKREIVWGTGLSSSGADELVVAGLNPGIEVEWTNADPVQLDGPFVGGALARSPTDAPAPLFVTMTTESGYAGSRTVRLDPVDGTLAISPEFDMTGSRFSIAAIDDYDSDDTDEALLASIGPWSTTPTVYDFYADSVEWQPPQFESAVQLASGNLTGDSRDELVWISWDGFVSVLDVATRQITRQSDALPGARGLRVADRDGNGIAEVYAITPSSLHHFYPLAAGSELVHYEAFPMAGNVLDVVVGDINGDGRSETFVLVDPHDPNGGSVVVPFDSELRPNPPFTLPWRARSIAIEPSPFGRKNLLVSRTEGNLPAGRLVTVDAQNGSVVSESPPLIGAIARDSVHYVDLGSSQPRISIGTDAGMYLTR